jgi:hypothetical protein
MMTVMNMMNNLQSTKLDDDCQEANTVGWTLALFPNEFRRTFTICSQRCSDRNEVATQAV